MVTKVQFEEELEKALAGGVSRLNGGRVADNIGESRELAKSVGRLLSEPNESIRIKPVDYRMVPPCF